MTVGAGLKQIREQRGFTLERLGDSLNPPMEKVQLFRLEGDKSNPTHKTLEKITHFLNYKMSEFYALIGD